MMADAGYSIADKRNKAIGHRPTQTEYRTKTGQFAGRVWPETDHALRD